MILGRSHFASCLAAAGGCDTREARRINRHAPVAAIYDQNDLPPCAAAKSATREKRPLRDAAAAVCCLFYCSESARRTSPVK